MLSLAEQTATADLCSRYNLPSATCHRYTHEAIRLSHLPNCDGRRVYFTDFVVNVGLLEQSCLRCSAYWLSKLSCFSEAIQDAHVTDMQMLDGLLPSGAHVCLKSDGF